MPARGGRGCPCPRGQGQGGGGLPPGGVSGGASSPHGQVGKVPERPISSPSSQTDLKRHAYSSNILVPGGRSRSSLISSPEWTLPMTRQRARLSRQPHPKNA